MFAIQLLKVILKTRDPNTKLKREKNPGDLNFSTKNVQA
jgi:hypothetical protein